MRGSLLLVSLVAGGAHAESWVPRPDLDVNALARLVEGHSPSLERARLSIELARADARQAGLLDNPFLDGGWGGVPLDGTALGQSARYGVGISWRALIGKRGARVDRASGLEEATQFSGRAAVRGEAFALARVLGGVAVAMLRLEALRGLVDEARGSVEVARARVRGGAATPLEVDRLDIDLARIEQQILATDAEIVFELASCAARVGLECGRFLSVDEARAFLEA